MVRGTCGVDAEAELNLPPGFRFYPTDEELVVHYLCRKAAHQRLPVPIIAEVDLYHYDPWQLPEKALFGQREWYYFTPRSRKYPKGSRPNRAAGGGYWKATGADKPISLAGRDPRPLGIKKSLVFYAGRPPTGVKTNWIMHEYRLAGSNHAANKKPSGSLRLDDWVLCRLYNKKNTWQQEERRRPRPEVASGAGETTEDTCSGGSLRTLSESDVDNDVNTTEDGRHGNPFGAGTLARQLVIPNTAHATGVSALVGGDDQGAGGRIKKEDGGDSWFGDLNLDGLGRSPVAPSMDLLYQEYLAALALPQLKPGHGTLPPF